MNCLRIIRALSTSGLSAVYLQAYRGLSMIHLKIIRGLFTRVFCELTLGHRCCLWNADGLLADCP